MNTNQSKPALKKYRRTHQGRFKPRNPEKYRGDITKIIYRSSWELKLLRYFDKHPDIIAYGSEICVIPYENPLTGKIHRYFTDFWIQKKDANGKINTIVIEVKPLKETMPPSTQGKNRKRMIQESETYAINSAKWEAAERYCREMGWKFIIMTEKQIYGKNR